MGFKLNFHPNKTKEVAKNVTQQATDIDVETLTNGLLAQNTQKLDFISQFQHLSDEISKAISKEFFNSQYKETPLLKKLKDIQTQASKAKTIEEIETIRQSLDSIVTQSNSTKNIEAGRQLGINSLINKK